MVSLKTERLKRYKDVTMLLVKYGRSDLVKQAGLEDSLELDDAQTAETAPKAEELAADLEKLGPTFIKLGQLLSTRADLLPPPYLEALSRLQDQIGPFPYEEVDRDSLERNRRSYLEGFCRLRSRTSSGCIAGPGSPRAHARRTRSCR